MKQVLNPLIGVFILGGILLSVSCSDEESDNPELNASPLTIDETKVSMNPGKSMQINILSGNGEYLLTSSNEEVVTASIAEKAITITAKNNIDNAEAIIFLRDKLKKEISIDVYVARLLELTVVPEQTKLLLGVEGKEETVVKIKSGNGEYETEMMENASHILEVNTENLNTLGEFSVKGVAEGSAKVKISDEAGKEVIVEFTVYSPEKITVNKQSILLQTVQGSDVLEVLTGEGNYLIHIGNPEIVKATVKESLITITGKTNGKTTLQVEDSTGQLSEVIEVEVNGSQYAMRLATQYFCHTSFSELAAVDLSITSCKQVTFELLCQMTGFRGGQTFLGLPGNLILRGNHDDYMSTHPIQISGLGDKIIMESTRSFYLHEWMHVALVVDCSKNENRDKYKLYINGEQDILNFTKEEDCHSSINLASSNDGNRFEIGHAHGEYWRAMNGIVSEARVWTTARSPEQIRNNMCILSETNPEYLLARWNFTAGCKTNYIQDISGGKYEINLKISEVESGHNYEQISIPASAFVDKGCPN